MRIAIRIDDIAASSKQFAVYSKLPGGNFLFLKYLPPFRAWGPYEELTAEQWEGVLEVLKKFGAKITIAITACWVERNCELVPFYQKYPQQAAVLKNAVKNGLAEIANHGLTHCVVGRHLPKLFSSNRKFHREFWDWLEEEVHFEHIEKSQKILQDYFQTGITTLTPPGNVFSQVTVKAAKQFGISRINCQTAGRVADGIKIIGNDNVFAFHDREIALYGIDWLRRELEKRQYTEYVFLKQL